MKRNLIKILAFVLVLSMLLPMSAFAASGKVYQVYVSISDKDSPKGPKTNTLLEEDLTLVSGDARIIDVLAQVVLAHYTKGNKSTDMYLFQSPEMQRQMDEGLAIITGGGDVKAAWAEYGEKYDDTWSCPVEPDLKPKLKNYDTTVGDVGTGAHFVQHYNKWENDAKYQVTYEVTIIIEEHSYSHDTDSDVTPDTDVIKVTTNDTAGEKGGTTTVDKTNPRPGEDVQIITKPNAGNMVYNLTVTDNNGNRVPMKYEGKGVYSFVMPEDGVSVAASYRQAPVEPEVNGVSDWLLTDEHVPFMVGYPEGDFRAESSITRAEVAMIFYRLLKNQNEPVTASFVDVKDSDWFSLPIEVLASLGIVNGDGNGNYDPNRAITRAEFAVIASRFVKTKETSRTFPDVNKDAWYAEGISTAAANGWVFGTEEGNFEPNRPIERAEAAAIVNRMLFRLSDREAIDEGHNRDFTDLKDSYWGWYEVAEATYGHTHSDDEELHVYYHENWIDGTGTEDGLYKGTEGK